MTNKFTDAADVLTELLDASHLVLAQQIQGRLEMILGDTGIDVTVDDNGARVRCTLDGVSLATLRRISETTVMLTVTPGPDRGRSIGYGLTWPEDGELSESGIIELLRGLQTACDAHSRLTAA